MAALAWGGISDRRYQTFKIKGQRGNLALLANSDHIARPPPNPMRRDVLFSGWLIHVLVLGAIAALTAITVLH